MYQLDRHTEAGDEPPPLSHTLPARSPHKPFASTSPHVMSLPPSTHGSFAIESSQRPAGTSRPSHSATICLTLTAVVLALLFFLLAGLAPVRLSHFVSSSASAALLLSSPSSQSYAAFVSNADNPLLLSVYLYNVTNAAAILNQAVPAALDELGPFVFTDTRRKLNPAFRPATLTTPATLSYTDWQMLTFAPERSCERCTLDASITTANLLAQGAYHVGLQQQSTSNSSEVLYAFNFYCLGINDTAGELPIVFSTRPARDMLFGYTDAMPGFSFPGFFPNRSLANTLSLNLLSTIRTGVDDLLTAHQYVNWQNQSVCYTCSPMSMAATSVCAWNTTVWATEAASTVRGSDGDVFTDVNGVSAASTPVLFFYPFQRSIALEYAGESSQLGLSALDFSFPASFFRSSAVHANNSDYYQYLDGAINLTSTASFVPLFATLPHLINVSTSSPLYPQQLTISNAQPSPSTANTFSIHPATGVLAHLSTSSQLNVLLQPIKYTIEDLSGQSVTLVWGDKLAPALLPLFYATEEGGLSEQQAAQLRQLDEVEQVLQWSPYGLWPAGALCAVAAVVGSVWLWRKRGAEQEELSGGKGKEDGAEVGSGLDEKTRLRVAAGGYGWYGQDQTEQEDDDG